MNPRTMRASDCQKRAAKDRHISASRTIVDATAQFYFRRMYKEGEERERDVL
jgi:hypothetical protein